MDFWSRLFGGTGTKRRQSTQDNSQQRLARFQRVYAHVTHVEQKVTSLSDDVATIESIKSSLQRLSSIIHDEFRSPAPHLCIRFCSSEAIYITISRVGWMCRNENVLREAIGVFSALVDSEEDDFVDNKDFAESMTALVEKTVSTGNIVINSDIVSETVELLFGIAAKIRLQPEILPIWFSSSKGRRDPGGHPNSDADFLGVTQKEDFPLCYHLIEHLHHEGRIGDFARTGLLYIFETASSSGGLEDWLVDSDIPTMMATGLGALYSQLSRKISILHPEEDMPIALTLSDSIESSDYEGAVNVFSKDLQLHLNTFLSYLTFWQDLLQLCNSASIKQTLLDHLKVLFLQQLLYPSILESSDRDGGSSVAVMYYLRQMLHTLDYPDLVHMVLEYLLALPESSDSRRNPPSSPVLQRRQSSLILLMQHKNTEGKMNPSLFSLTDLILNSMRSSDAQTVIAALKLVSVLIDRNHEYVLNTLIKSQAIQSNSSRRTIGSLDAETETYLSLAEKIGAKPDLDEAYESHLKNITELLEAHRCTARLPDGNLAVPTGINQVMNPTQSLRAHHRMIGPHRLSTFDPTLLCLCSLLESFFTNDVETNLSLTECFVNLASCPYLRLERWMVVDSSRYSHPHESYISTNMADLHSVNSATGMDSPDSDVERLNKYRFNLSRPSWVRDESPHLLNLLQSLVSQLEKLRDKVPSFLNLLSTRKATFRTHDALMRAGTDSAASMGIPITPEFSSSSLQDQKSQTPSQTPRPSTPSTPASKAEVLSSLPRRLFTETLNLSPSRKNSPSVRRAPPLASAADDHDFEGPHAHSNTPMRQHHDISDSPSSVHSVSSTTLPISTFPNGEVALETPPPRIPRSAQNASEREITASSAATPVSTASDAHMAQKAFILLTKRIKFFQDGRVELESNQPGRDIHQSPRPFTSAQNKTDDAVSKGYKPKEDNRSSSSTDEDEDEDEDENTDGGNIVGQSKSSVNSKVDVESDGDEDKDEDESKSKSSNGNTDSTDPNSDADSLPEFKAVSLNHVLTNAVVLQEFILELVALLQVRASLFGEVQFG